MLTPLLRAGFFLLLYLVLGVLPGQATHLIGGSLAYRYLDATGPANTPFRYEISLRVFVNREPGSQLPGGRPNIELDIFSKGPGENTLLVKDLVRDQVKEITPPVTPGCAIRPLRVGEVIYRTVVTLPLVAEGYRVVYSDMARNAGIVNIVESVVAGMSLTLDMAPPTLPNSSPVFSDDPQYLLCVGDTATILNNAYDAEGDRLLYRLIPAAATPTTSVVYAAGYSATEPFGSRGFAAVDARTGLARYLSRTEGLFSVVVEVLEYRRINGQEVLLSRLQRDIQVVVRSCGAVLNQAPGFASLPATDYVVEEGRSLAFAITATDPETQPLTMKVSSVLLDGAGPIEASVNGLPGDGRDGSALGTVRVTGQGQVTGTFRLTAGCGLARPTPYEVLVTVADETCGSKIIAAIFRVTVTRQAPPSQVRGDSVLCGQKTAVYTAVGPAFASYRWKVRGGVVQGAATGSSVRVLWLGNVQGTVVVQGITPLGCPTDSVSRTVRLGPGPPVTGPRLYCPSAGTGLRYTIAGAPLAYQWTITDGTLVSGQGTNDVVVDVPEGVTATLQVAPPAAGGCLTTLLIQPDNQCLAFYNIITPNGDGKNDLFVVKNIEQHPNTSLTIFNRWGRQVYQSSDYRNTYDGQAAGPGVYYYLCQLADGRRYKGWFEVVR